MTFATIAISWCFENGIQLLACYIINIRGIISVLTDYLKCPIKILQSSENVQFIHNMPVGRNLWRGVRLAKRVAHLARGALTAGVWGPLKAPRSSGVFGAKSCIFSLPILLFPIKCSLKTSFFTICFLQKTKLIYLPTCINQTVIFREFSQ